MSPRYADNRNTARKRVEIDSLHFDLLEHQQRFLSFDKTARAFANQDFEHRPYELLGSFVQAVWAKGIGFDEPCTLRGPRASNKDIHRITVDTIVTPVPGRAKAAALRVEVIPADADKWCVYLYYREAAKQNVTEPGWSILFFRWDPAKLGIVPFRPQDNVKDRLEIPLLQYAISASDVHLPSKLSVNDSFLRYVRSADAMRDAFLADLAEVEKQAIAFLDAHKAMKKVYGESRGNLPPPEHLEPLTAREEKAERAKAKEYFAAQAQFMRAHHDEMYAALRKSFPLERCWKELTEQDKK